MTGPEDDRPLKPLETQIVVGEDLTRLSEEELQERIGRLEAEIIRTRETLSQRGTVRDAADALFGKRDR